MDSRFTKVLNNVLKFGKTFTDKEITIKVLKALPPKFNMKITAMEESRDLGKISLTELFSVLKAYEYKMPRMGIEETSTSNPTAALVAAERSRRLAGKIREVDSSDETTLLNKKEYTAGDVAFDVLPATSRFLGLLIPMVNSVFKFDHRKCMCEQRTARARVVLMVILVPNVNAKCAFEAMFVFGDSNSDTGGFYAAFPSQTSPYGMTYFGKPTGRPTDGRIFVDFLAQGLGFPFISLYIQSIGSDFRHGANFATLGPGGVKEIGPQAVSQIQSAIKEIYNLGGRTILVLNLAPVGCYPAFLVQFPHQSSDIDQAGCMTSYNNAVNEYNSMLKQAVQQTRGELQDANIIYVDTYSVLLELFQCPTAHGMQHGTVACCGYGGGSYNYNQQVSCGNTKDINGQSATASACSDPQNYVSWDGIHFTEAANRIMANAILSGKSFDPGFSFNQYCDIQPIG
ncbi:hypothetical protein RD792_006844 [Penstemon davidsonii]|uniref:GDSL esterase/lipase n=1 Tax=Penstemon davidsonii TaxID=160366 RepID=A0ABR0DCY9_9LAMI|nr:hypothetical protein RD792_006844 [Penstemon davidsonii]